MAITAQRRHTLFLALGLVTFAVAVLHGCAAALPLWSVDLPTEYGIWSTCTRSTGWLVRQCQELHRVGVCNGWYQATRACWAIAAAALILSIFLCLISATQTVPTNTAPTLIVILNLITFFMTLMTWVSWFVYRGEDCNGWEGSRLGASFIEEVIAWVLSFIPLFFAYYLRSTKIFVPTSDKTAEYEAATALAPTENYALPTPNSPAYYP